MLMMMTCCRLLERLAQLEGENTALRHTDDVTLINGNVLQAK